MLRLTGVHRKKQTKKEESILHSPYWQKIKSLISSDKSKDQTQALSSKTIGHSVHGGNLMGKQSYSVHQILKWACLLIEQFNSQSQPEQ